MKTVFGMVCSDGPIAALNLVLSTPYSLDVNTPVSSASVLLLLLPDVPIPVNRDLRTDNRCVMS